METASNYQNRTKAEEYKSGRHSLFKIWFIAIDAVGNETTRYYLSFKNRVVSRTACYEYLRDYVKRHDMKEKTTIKFARMIDNQTDELMQVYEFGVWRNPTEADILNHNGKRR